MSAVNVRYGLYPGDRLMITAGKKKKRATVVKEYPFHILMDGSQLRNGYIIPQTGGICPSGDRVASPNCSQAKCNFAFLNC